MMVSRIKTKKLRGKPAPLPICPSSIMHKVTRDSIQGSLIRRQCPTVSAMIRPEESLSFLENMTLETGVIQNNIFVPFLEKKKDNELKKQEK
jgi:hypothetical protein